MSDIRQGVLYVNGRLCAEGDPSLSALDRGFTLGDGVFETLLARARHIFRLARHLERLERGAAVLELALPPRDELVGVLGAALARLSPGEAVVRLTVTRGPDPGRGVALPPSATPTVVVRAVPAARPPDEAYGKGWRAVLSSVRRNEGSPLSRIKSCNYGDAILARREAQKGGADEAILLNNRGEVACAATANIFVLSQGRLRTPPEECGVLAGITRACVVALAVELGIPVDQTAFGPDLLLGAEEVFISNTALGLMALTELEGRAIGGGRPGPVTLRLAATYDDLVQAELADAAATA